MYQAPAGRRAEEEPEIDEQGVPIVEGTAEFRFLIGESRIARGAQNLGCPEWPRSCAKP